MKNELRNFGITSALFLLLIFYFILPYLFKANKPVWPIYTSSSFLILGIVAPIVLKPIFIIWMKIGHFLGVINSKIILTLVFYLLFTPMALLLKILGKQPIKTDKKLSSYYKKSIERKPNHMERPF